MVSEVSDGSERKEVYQMTLDQRLNPDPRHTPDNIVPFDRTERRTKPRWMQRMEEQGLPDKDYTFGAYVPSGSHGAA